MCGDNIGPAAISLNCLQESSFLTDQLQSTMVLDARLSTHPIIVPIAHPDDINAAFDSITYGKVIVYFLYFAHMLFRRIFANMLLYFVYWHQKTLTPE